MKTTITHRPNNLLIYPIVAFILMLACMDSALAGSAQNLPWESPLEKLKNSMEYIGYFIAVIAFVVWGGMMAFGGELSEFGRKAVNVMLAVGIISGGGALFTGLFGGQAALM